MPTTDTSEKGLESLIVAALTGQPVSDTLTAARDGHASYGGVSYVQGASRDFDHCSDHIGNFIFSFFEDCFDLVDDFIFDEF